MQKKKRVDIEGVGFIVYENDELTIEWSKEGTITVDNKGIKTTIHSYYANEDPREGNMEPTSIIAAIAAALGLADKFISLVRTLRSEKPKPFRVEAKQENDKLVIRENLYGFLLH